MDESPKVIRLAEGDPDLEYLLEGVNDEQKRKLLTDFYYRHAGGDPQAFPIQFLECMKIFIGAGIRNTGRMNRGFAAFLESLNESLDGFLQKFEAVTGAHEARVKGHADALTDSTLATVESVKRIEEAMGEWRESEAAARFVAVRDLHDRIGEVLVVASKSYDLSSQAKASALTHAGFIAVLCVVQVLLILAVAFIILLKL